MQHNCEEIQTFRHLLDIICYSLDSDVSIVKEKDFRPHSTDVYVINKLYIRPNSVEYKCESHPIKPEVYEKFLKFYELLEE